MPKIEWMQIQSKGVSEVNELPNGADRYTMLVIKLDEIEEKVKACQELGLTWIIEPQGVSLMSRIEMHVFFDKAGKENYQAGLYDDNKHGSIRWELVDGRWLMFSDGVLRASIDTMDDNKGFSYIVERIKGDPIEEDFKGSISIALGRAENVLKAAME